MGNFVVLAIFIFFELLVFNLFKKEFKIGHYFVKSLIVVHVLFALASIFFIVKDIFYEHSGYGGGVRNYYRILQFTTLWSYFSLVFLITKKKVSYLYKTVSVVSLLIVIFLTAISYLFFVFQPMSYGEGHLDGDYYTRSYIDGLDGFSAGESVVKKNSLGITVSECRIYVYECSHNYPYSVVNELEDEIIFSNKSDTCSISVNESKFSLYFPLN